MDYKRIALIAALAVVSYLLLLQWNSDYPSGGSTVAVQTRTSNTGDIPVAVSPADQGSGDIPQVAAPVQQPGDVAVTTATSGNLITVTTPVHRVQIDPQGGDIVRLSLPTYPTTLDTPDDPFVLLQNDASAVYIAQSGLVGSNGPDANGRPLYQASQNSYVLNSADGTLSVPLTYTDAEGVTYTKTFVFSGNDFLIDVTYTVENPLATAWKGNLFGQIRRSEFDDPSGGSKGMGVKNYLGAALTTPDDTYKKVDFDDMEDGTRDEVTGGWIAFSQHYFLGSWIPEAEKSNTYTTFQNNAGQYFMRFVSGESTVAPMSTGTITAGFWAGPKDQYRLKEISPHLDLTIDYGRLWFVAQPIFWLLTTLDQFIGNYGWSIIAMTLVIKICLFWLSSKSYRSMAKMRKLTPHVNALKERFGDDKQKLMQAQMELWKKEKVNPMGGCLPMLLQMPVLIGIYWVLNESVELRHAPWMLWYQDLSAMDPYFILPLIMGASMYASQLMTPMTTMDPMQAKMLRLMPLFFTIFFFWFPSGLVLYWLVSNVFNIAQQWYINKQVDKTFKPKHT